MSSEDYTRTVVLKRSAKKKSGYAILEKNGEYFVHAIPPKARVNEGDKVVGINGITSDEFVDEDDANDLIESIRIVVVPEDQIANYEAAKEAEEAGDVAGEESSEEEYEEVQRPIGQRKKAAAASAASAPESALVIRDDVVSEECKYNNESINQCLTQSRRRKKRNKFTLVRIADLKMSTRKEMKMATWHVKNAGPYSR